MAQSKRWAEFVAFYGAAPLAMAVLLPPSAMFPVLFGVTALGLLLLHITPEFAWRDLVAGSGRIDWRFVAVFSLATVAVGTGVVFLTAPQALGALIRQNPGLMLMIALLYPVLSALPQEVVFRPLFFRRYGSAAAGRRERADIAERWRVFVRASDVLELDRRRDDVLRRAGFCVVLQGARQFPRSRRAAQPGRRDRIRAGAGGLFLFRQCGATVLKRGGLPGLF